MDGGKLSEKGVYKLTCTNCNKFYIGRTNIRFKEYRKDFRYAEGKSKFSEVNARAVSRRQNE